MATSIKTKHVLFAQMQQHRQTVRYAKIIAMPLMALPVLAAYLQQV